MAESTAGEAATRDELIAKAAEAIEDVYDDVAGNWAEAAEAAVDALAPYLHIAPTNGHEAKDDPISVLQRSLSKPDGDLYEHLLRSFEEPLNRDSAESAADTAAGLVMRTIRRTVADVLKRGESRG